MMKQLLDAEANQFISRFALPPELSVGESFGPLASLAPSVRLEEDLRLRLGRLLCAPLRSSGNNLLERVALLWQLQNRDGCKSRVLLLRKRSTALAGAVARKLADGSGQTRQAGGRVGAQAERRKMKNSQKLADELGTPAEERRAASGESARQVTLVARAHFRLIVRRFAAQPLLLLLLRLGRNSRLSLVMSPACLPPVRWLDTKVATFEWNF